MGHFYTEPGPAILSIRISGRVLLLSFSEIKAPQHRCQLLRVAIKKGQTLLEL